MKISLNSTPAPVARSIGEVRWIVALFVAMGIQVDKQARLLKAQQIAALRGGMLLDDQYRGVDVKVNWRCVNGHEFSSSYYSVVIRGKWCAVCSNRVLDPELRLKEAREIASARGGQLISTNYVNSHENLRWRCAEGHEWDATLSNTKRAKWCPWCAGNKVDSAVQLKRARDRAVAMGGSFLGTAYVGNKTPLRWRCKEGHEWEAAFSTVVNRGAWCALCSGTAVVPEGQLELARSAAILKGGKCLSAEYVRNTKPMEWECGRGHRWVSVFYSVVQAGTWCPVCSAGLRERLTRHTFEALLGVLFKKALPKWLVNPNTRRRLELDGYNEELRVAFEYQGDQHNRVVLPFKMTAERLRRQQERDSIKREICAVRGVRLIEVPSDVPATDLPKLVHGALSTFNDLRDRLRPWQGVQPFEWLESEAYSIDNLCDAASARGGKCLSATYLGAREKHHWCCSKGHEWSAVWDAVRRGGWCPVCAKSNPVEVLEQMRRAASDRGGDCCSEGYFGGRVKYRWRCERGHEWEARWDSVKAGSWCPRCAAGHTAEIRLARRKI
jgi:hypothetical protein